MAEALTRTYSYTGSGSAASGNFQLSLSSFGVSGDTRPITQILSITVEHRRFHDTSSTVGYTAKLIFANGADSLLTPRVAKRGDREWHNIINTFVEMPDAANFIASNVSIAIIPDAKSNQVYWQTANTGARVTVTVTYYSSEFKPSLSDIKLYRANEIGAAANSGLYITFRAKAAVESAGTGGSGVVKLYAVDAETKLVSGGTLVFSQSISGSTSGITVTKAPIPGYTLAIGSAQYFKIVFSYTATTGSGVSATETIESAAIFVDRVFTNFHLAGVVTGGACFGGFSTSAADDPKFESHFPAYFYAGIEGVTNYSADEADTGGTWIDGSAIYRRTVAVSVSAGIDITSGAIASSLGAVISIKGSFYRPSDGKWFPVNFWRSDSTYVNCHITEENKLMIKAAWAGTAYVTVTYTK